MSRRLRSLCLVLTTAVFPTMISAQGRPLAIEDFYRIRDVGNPEMSPDGRWVAFTIGTRIEATNGTEYEVWLVASDGSSTARKVSAPNVNATAPEWRDDGRLRYTTGRRQIAVDPAHPDWTDSVAVDSGRPRTLRSSDGRWVATVRDVSMAPRATPARTDFERRHDGRFKGVAFDWYPFMEDGRPFPVPNRNDPELSPPQEIFVSAASDEGVLPSGRQLTTLGLRPSNLDWSRDGTHLLFVADSNYRSERRYGRSELYSVTVADGHITRLTPNLQFEYSSPHYSPDGRRILTTRGLADNFIIAQKLNHGGATDLVILPSNGGVEINLTATWDFLPSQPVWSNDGKYVYFAGGIGGTTHFFRVASTGGTVEQLTKGDRRMGELSIDKGQTTIAYTVAVMERPTEIHVANIDGSGERQLTHVHDDLTREIALEKAERVRFKSADGTPIEGWLWKPAGYRAGSTAQRYPFIVSSHGGPHAADGYGFNFRNQYFAANGYFVLVTNFRSSTGYGEKFLWGTWGAWGTKDGQDVMAGVDHVIATYPIDRSRVGAIGHSYGGFMTNWLITQYPDRFAAAIPGAGIVNWVSDYGNADIPITKEKEFWGAPWDLRARETMIRQSPLTYANRVTAPTLFIVGEVDQRVPYSETQQMYTALKKNGVPAKVIRYAGMAHSISGHWNQVHRMLSERQWMDRWVKQAPL